MQRIKDFCQKHYQWFLSGIGGTLIVSLIPLYCAKHEPVSDNSKNKEINHQISNIDALKIINEIDKVAPFQQSQLASNYTGLRIKWETKLVGISRISDEKYHVMSLYKGNYPWVYFEINIIDYPNLRVAKKGHEFILIGTILEISGNTITIQAERIIDAKNI
jgi:hypothetical protein